MYPVKDVSHIYTKTVFVVDLKFKFPEHPVFLLAKSGNVNPWIKLEILEEGKPALYSEASDSES